VSAALKFATKHNIRVTVRNTGHDFLARHSGVGGLTISTTGIKGVTYHPEWKPTAGSAEFVKRQENAKITAAVMGSGTTFNNLGTVLKPRGQATVRGADAVSAANDST
jgi:FAD/FMN-containing dehydrogenase